MSTSETCTRCWEQVPATHADTGLCPKCVRAEGRQARSRQRAPRVAAPALPGQIDIFDVLAEIEGAGA